MEQHHHAKTIDGGPVVYQITVKGQLSADWCAWFDGMTITHAATGATHITGPLADQAALHGLLRKVRDLGLTLLALSCGAWGSLDGFAADTDDRSNA